jgi:hypothetical protein
MEVFVTSFAGTTLWEMSQELLFPFSIGMAPRKSRLNFSNFMGMMGGPIAYLKVSNINAALAVGGFHPKPFFRTDRCSFLDLP